MYAGVPKLSTQSQYPGGSVGQHRELDLAEAILVRDVTPPSPVCFVTPPSRTDGS